MKRFLYILTECVWGFPQTAAGLVLFIANIKKRHYLYHGAVVTEWDHASSVSLGLFLFISSARIEDRRIDGAIPSEYMARALLVHEYGHTIQSLFFGPLYLFLIGIPSFAWGALPRYRKQRKKGRPYSDFWTERSANKLGERATKERSLEGAVF